MPNRLPCPRPDRAILPEDHALFNRAAVWDPAEQFTQLSVDRLAQITRVEGIEFATALLHDRVLKVPAYETFCRAAQSPPTVQEKPEVLGIVPGAFHGQHKHTGADGIRLAETFEGLAAHIEIIPVRSFGLLEENAGTILDWLEARRGRRLALASISKGGADLKRALASPRAPTAFASVSAWISVSGIVQGTPLVAWLQARPLRSGAFSLLLRLQGHRAAAVDELRHQENSSLAPWPALPRHLRIVHVAAFPLARHLSHRWAARGYERLAPMGPNDGGGILLGDLTELPGVICPVWGADHYFQPGWDATPLLRGVAAAALAPR